jgi:hypothetical protein
VEKLVKLRVSPALVISILALVLAAGGTSLASASAGFVARTFGFNKVERKQAKTLIQREIKINAPKLSVLFARTAANALSANSAATAASATSAVNAKSAANAKSAGYATTAGTANNANTVGGKQIKQFFMKGAANTPVATVLSIDGIVIKAGCDASSHPVATIEDLSSVRAEAHGLTSNQSIPTEVKAIADSSLGAAPLDIVNGFTAGSGQLTIARADGIVVSILFSMDYPSTFGGEQVCTVNGSAIG